MTQERDDYMRRQEADHDLIRMRTPPVRLATPAERAIPMRPVASIGVPPMTRQQIHDAKGECADCYELGHICRPCRKARYEARQANDAGLVVIYYAVGLLAIAVAVVVAVTRG